MNKNKKKKDTKLNVRISHEKKEKLHEVAGKLDRKISDLVRMNIEQLIELHS